MAIRLQNVLNFEVVRKVRQFQSRLTQALTAKNEKVFNIIHGTSRVINYRRF